jgi:hypothetical protein
LPHRATVSLNLFVNRGVKLPENVFIPGVPVEEKEQETFRSPLVFSAEEARSIMAYYGKSGEPTKDGMKDLAELIKEELMEWVVGTKHR